MKNDVLVPKPPTPVAKSKNQPNNTNLNSKCSVCNQTFKNVTECLKHELLAHTLQKKSTSVKKIATRLKAADEFLKTPEKQEERKKVHDVLQKCPRGMELKSILKLLSLDSESLSLIFTRIQTCLAKELSKLGPVKIYPFGSAACGLALRDSDIDIYMDATQIVKHNAFAYPGVSQKNASFNRISKALYLSPHFVDVFSVRQARVPIIKCKHRETGFSIDINTCRRSSLLNTQFIRELVCNDNRIHDLLLFLKLWAKNALITGKFSMTSYCLITMVIFYLQQPLKLKMEKQEEEVKILKSVKELQVHCHLQITEGINYAFDLDYQSQNRPKIPNDVTTLDLLREFFHFYKNFNYDDYIISPFLGKAIAKVDFNNQKFKEYKSQMAAITQFMEGVPAAPIAVDSCMCVQDSFALNHNVARSMLPPGKQYFLMCLEKAHNICENPNNATYADILEKLLYETSAIITDLPTSKSNINPILNKNETTTFSQTVTENITKNLSYFIEPGKADLNCIVNFKTDLSNLKIWCDHYVEAIPKCLSAFYHIDMQTQVETPQKQQRLDDGDNNLTHVWHMTASVDLWSNRFFQKSLRETFWEYQVSQTQRLHELRRQDANFSINLKAILTINVLPDYKGIYVSLALPDGQPTAKLGKKNALRKFFNSIKNTFQNYSFKEALAMEAMTPEKSNNDEDKGSEQSNEVKQRV